MNRRWVNPNQPQTLFLVQVLMYFQGVIGLLVLTLGIQVGPLGFAALVAKPVAAFGIANEQRWGYRLGVLAAAIPLVERLWESLTTRLSLLWADPISLLFDIALLSLLLHIHSREYYRYWFTGR